MCKTLGKYITGSQQLFKHSRTFRDRNRRILKSQKNRIQNYGKTDVNRSQRL